MRQKLKNMDLFSQALDHIFCGNDGSDKNPGFYLWMNDLDKARSFLEHTKIVTFVQADLRPGEDKNNLCKDVDE